MLRQVQPVVAAGHRVIAQQLAHQRAPQPVVHSGCCQPAQSSSINAWFIGILRVKIAQRCEGTVVQGSPVRIEYGESVLWRPHDAGVSRQWDPIGDEAREMHQFLHRDPGRGVLEQHEHASVLQQMLNGGEVGEPFGAASPPCRRARVDDDAAADGPACLGVAHDEGVACARAEWRFKNELYACADLSLQAIRVEQNRLRNAIRGT